MNWQQLIPPALMITGAPFVLKLGRAIGHKSRTAWRWAGAVSVLDALAALADVLLHDTLAANVAAVACVFWLSFSPTQALRSQVKVMRVGPTGVGLRRSLRWPKRGV
jgi:hypothetical protein